jgi:chromosome segregation ATPase
LGTARTDSARFAEEERLRQTESQTVETAVKEKISLLESHRASLARAREKKGQLNAALRGENETLQSRIVELKKQRDDLDDEVDATRKQKKHLLRSLKEKQELAAELREKMDWLNREIGERLKLSSRRGEQMQMLNELQNL